MTPDNLFNLFFFSIPFWVPAVIGFYLIANRRNELSLMAGLLTLKPIVTTPIWLAIFVSLEGAEVGSALNALFSILPGASLSVLAVVIFRRIFFGPRPTLVRTLIVLDCMRWINSGLLVATASLSYNNPISGLGCIFAPIGLIFPTAYSVVALTAMLVSNERQTVA